MDGFASLDGRWRPTVHRFWDECNLGMACGAAAEDREAVISDERAVLKVRVLEDGISRVLGFRTRAGRGMPYR